MVRPVVGGGDVSASTLVILPDKSTIEFLGKLYQLKMKFSIERYTVIS